MDCWCYRKLASPTGSFQYTFQEFVHKSLGNSPATSGSLAARCHIGAASTHPANAKRTTVPFPRERGTALSFPEERGQLCPSLERRDSFVLPWREGTALPFPGEKGSALPFPGENSPVVCPLRFHIFVESMFSQGASLRLLVPIFQKPGFLENGSKAGPLAKEPLVTKA